MESRTQLKTVKITLNIFAVCFLVDGKALDNRFYTQMRVQIKNKAFAYRGTIGDYNY